MNYILDGLRQALILLGHGDPETFSAVWTTLLVTFEGMGGVPDEEIEVVVDIGLVSQVYANLFSNAVKYTREVVDADGRKRRFISYGWDRKKNFFGPGRDGIKLNVFTSGPPIPPETAAHLFEEGVRGENASGEYGTGHGLYFIREVVRLHDRDTNRQPGYAPGVERPESDRARGLASVPSRSASSVPGG